MEEFEKVKPVIEDETLAEAERGESYEESVTINNINIDVRPGEYNRYRIDFPQIKSLEKDDDYRSYINLTKSPQFAKNVFNYAKEKALKVDNIYRLFDLVEKYVNDTYEKFV